MVHHWPKELLIWHCTYSSLFGPDGTVNYDYIATNIINSLLIDLICIPNDTHTNHCWAKLAYASKVTWRTCTYVCTCTWCYRRCRTKEERKKERKTPETMYMYMYIHVCMYMNMYVYIKHLYIIIINHEFQNVLKHYLVTHPWVRVPRFFSNCGQWNIIYNYNYV